MRIASTVNGLGQFRALELGARALLNLPLLPDAATGPVSREILAEINKDLIDMGFEACIRKHAAKGNGVSVAYAAYLDNDDDWVKAASRRHVSTREHPTQKGRFYFPDSTKLHEALSNPTARARCSQAALNALESHAAQAGPLSEDWEPPGQARAHAA